MTQNDSFSLISEGGSSRESSSSRTEVVRYRTVA